MYDDDDGAVISRSLVKHGRVEFVSLTCGLFSNGLLYAKFESTGFAAARVAAAPRVVRTRPRESADIVADRPLCH